MRLLLDTNVALDALLARQPWVGQARAIWEAHQKKQLQIHMTASAVTDIFYIVRKASGVVRACIDQLVIIPVSVRELRAAHALGGIDFEDRLQKAVAMTAQLDAIVTRDPRGFGGSQVPAMTPDDVLLRLNAGP